jgi:hypothetical protein
MNPFCGSSASCSHQKMVGGAWIRLRSCRKRGAVEASQPHGGRAGHEEMGTDTEVDGRDGAGETDPMVVRASSGQVPVLGSRRRGWWRSAGTMSA